MLGRVATPWSQSQSADNKASEEEVTPLAPLLPDQKVKISPRKLAGEEGIREQQMTPSTR